MSGAVPRTYEAAFCCAGMVTATSVPTGTPGQFSHLLLYRATRTFSGASTERILSGVAWSCDARYSQSHRQPCLL
ncbi:hypothetical protein OE88DRAFT_1665227 [Heliocybe sulcata]|uniref:Uncharacterized protein n=1 Tax=Heliocybe sulcata TaxID=5364 RepID=A0A5C3MT01_9AGAM|nr:hypothetical protein OE88DRAFT_1665227 [Heliocybe sulcata]